MTHAEALRNSANELLEWRGHVDSEFDAVLDPAVQNMRDAAVALDRLKEGLTQIRSDLKEST